MNASTDKAIPRNNIWANKESTVRMIKNTEKMISVIEMMIFIPFKSGWRVRLITAVAILAIEKPMLKAPNKIQSKVISILTKIKIAPNATEAIAETAL